MHLFAGASHPERSEGPALFDFVILSAAKDPLLVERTEGAPLLALFARSGRTPAAARSRVSTSP